MKRSVLVICLLALLTSVFVFAGCGDGDEGSSDSAETVFEKFFAAWENGDADAMWDYFSKDTKESLDNNKKLWNEVMADEEIGGMTFEIGKVKVDGDTATSEVTAKMPGEEDDTTTVTLVKEKGKWKVDMTSLD